MWGVRNAPSILYKLVWNGTYWMSTTENGWSNGKLLLYPDGTPGPDSEDVTKTEWESDELFVCSERIGSGSSRLSVLRYLDNTTSSTLKATNEWNLTKDLPTVDSNLGFEAITWIPDSYLV